MNFITMIYLADIAAGFTVAMVILFVLLAVISIVLAACALEDACPFGFKPSLFTAIASVIMLMLSVLCPSKQGLYTMAAAKGVEIAASSPDVKRLAGKSLDVLEQAMDKYLDKPKKVE